MLLRKSSLYIAAVVTLMTLLYGLSGCSLGPHYKPPLLIVPSKFKEAPKGWKVADPKDVYPHREWWKVFNDPVLNELEARVNVSNQSIAGVYAQYMQSLAMVNEARASFFPDVTANLAVTREKLATFVAKNASAPPSETFRDQTFTNYIIGVGATWVPDIWGSVAHQVEANVATAQATAAQLAATQLSMQGTLAQDYFQLRTLDNDQLLLDNTIIAYKKSLALVQSRFKQGVAAMSDVVQAQAQLKTAEAQGTDNKISRAQFEHAIAVLIGVPPANFSIKPRSMKFKPPKIPVEIPSQLLERRPDVAQAERQVASANAQIGVAVAAFFPTVTLSALAGYQTNILADLFTQPSLYWAIGPQVAATLFNGGLYYAQLSAARATYWQQVANYRQTVLAAFQNVEDNLSSLRILEEEVGMQHAAVIAQQKALRFVINAYKAGTAAYTDVIVSENTVYSTEKAESDIAGRQMVAAVSLIMAIGGGWDDSQIVINSNLTLPSP